MTVPYPPGRWTLCLAICIVPAARTVKFFNAVPLQEPRPADPEQTKLPLCNARRRPKSIPGADIWTN